MQLTNQPCRMFGARAAYRGLYVGAETDGERGVRPPPQPRDLVPPLPQRRQRGRRPPLEGAPVRVRYLHQTAYQRGYKLRDIL